MKKFFIPTGFILMAVIGTVWTAAGVQEKNQNAAASQNMERGGRVQYGDPGADPFFEEDPFLELEKFHRRMQRWMHSHYRPEHHGFGEFSQGGFFSEPRIDVEDLTHEIVIRCDLPGIEKDKIELSLTDNVVVIQGTRDVVQQENKNSGGVRVYQSERSTGSFYRAIPLAVEVDSSKAAANYENGVLTIHLPKVVQEEKKTTAIQIT
jgi:HSP20 family protein